MNLQTLLNSRSAGMFALWVSRQIPPRLGYRLGDFIAARIAARGDLPLVQGIRINQQVVIGGHLSEKQLDQAVLDTLRNIAYGYYDVFHYMESPEALCGRIVYSPLAQEVVANSQKRERGVVILGVHMSSFDAVMLATAHRGLRAIGLSLPQPDEAVEWQHDYRRKAGIEILPASVANIRQAIHRLQDGETVLTGLDRPMPEAKYRPQFFGRPANVPVHYIPLALKARVPVVVMAAIRHDDGAYHVLSSDYLKLEPHSNRQLEIVLNAEKVLKEAEAFIRQAPQQWAVFQPAWVNRFA